MSRRCRRRSTAVVASVVVATAVLRTLLPLVLVVVVVVVAQPSTISSIAFIGNKTVPTATMTRPPLSPPPLFFRSVLGRDKDETLYRSCKVRKANPIQRPKIICQFPLNVDEFFAPPSLDLQEKELEVQPEEMELVLRDEDDEDDDDDDDDDDEEELPFSTLLAARRPRRRPRPRIKSNRIGGFAAAGNNQNSNNGGKFFLVTTEDDRPRMYTIDLQVNSFSRKPPPGQTCGSARIVDVCFFSSSFDSRLIRGGLQGVATAPGGNVFVLFNETIREPISARTKSTSVRGGFIGEATVGGSSGGGGIDLLAAPATRQAVASFDPNCREVTSEAFFPLPEAKKRTIVMNAAQRTVFDAEMEDPFRGRLPERQRRLRRRRGRLAQFRREEVSQQDLDDKERKDGLGLGRDDYRATNQKRRRRLQSSSSVLPPVFAAPTALKPNTQPGFQSISAQPNGQLLWTATQRQERDSSQRKETLTSVLPLNVTGRRPSQLEFLYRADNLESRGFVDTGLIDLLAVDNGGTSWTLERAVRRPGTFNATKGDRSNMFDARLYETQFFSAVSTVNDTGGKVLGSTGQSNFQSVSADDVCVPWIAPKRLLLDIGERTLGSARVEAITKVHQTPNRLGVVLLFGTGTSGGGDDDDIGVGGDITFVPVAVPTMAVSVGEDLIDEILILINDLYPGGNLSLRDHRRYLRRRARPIDDKHLPYQPPQCNQVIVKAQEMVDYMNVTSHCPTAFNVSLNDCLSLRLLCEELVEWGTMCCM